MTAAASAVPGIDMASLLSDPSVQSEAPQAPLEAALSSVTPEDAVATSSADAKFEFRSLLDEKQRELLKKGAPELAERMIKDYNVLLNFGAPVMEKMNQASVLLLNEQKDIKIPEADQIVNNLLRQLDGYSAKYRNFKMEEMGSKILKWFKGAGYTVKTMIRDAKPIAERLDEVELKIRQMELDLGANSARARKLHEQTLETMDDVVGVLAALEEITEYLREKFARADALLREAGAEEREIVFEDKKYSLTEFKEYVADLAQGLSEIEKSWSDWRTQFFLGFASAPVLRNLILMSVAMQRKLMVFRTQGIPSSRRNLAMWQQAVLAKEGATMGTALQDATNKMIQDSFAASADAVEHIAKATQAPIITEETVLSIVDSIRAQTQSIVDADRWGREQRARVLSAFERGEKDITQLTEEGKRQLVANAMDAASSKAFEGAPKDAPEVDILAQLSGKN